MIRTPSLFDLSHSIAGSYLSCFAYPWQSLAGLRQLIEDLGAQLPDDYIQISPQVWVHRTADVSPTAQLSAPCIIGAHTQVRHCAFLRGSVLVGESCVVGNSVELKNVILFDKVQVPHLSYVGDSILGYQAHMGAGSLISNVRSDKKTVAVRSGDGLIPTGLKKLGAMVGDGAEIGCGAVLNPGTVVGRNSRIYPLSCVRGTVPTDSIWKTDGTVVAKKAFPSGEGGAQRRKRAAKPQKAFLSGEGGA